ALRGHQNLVRQVEFSPDSKLLATVGSEAKVKLWEIPSGKLVRELDSQAQQVAFSPDGKWLAAAEGDGLRLSQGGALTLWSLGTGGGQVRVGDKGPLTSVAWRQDGKRLLAGTGSQKQPGRILVWDVALGRETAAFTPGFGHAHRAIYHPRDMSTILLGGWGG